MEERIRYAALRDKITDAASAASHIGGGTNLFISFQKEREKLR